MSRALLPARRAHAAGMAVIVKEALANGRLGPRAPGAALEELAPLEEDSEEYRSTRSALHWN